MSPATGIAISLLLPPLAAALLMLLSKWIPRRLSDGPLMVPVAGAVLATAFLLRWSISVPAGDRLTESFPPGQLGLLDDDLAVLWQMASLLAGLLLLIGLRQPGHPHRVCGLLLTTGATAIAGCTSDLLAMLVCLELATAGAALASPGLKSSDLPQHDLPSDDIVGASHPRPVLAGFVPARQPAAGAVPLILAGLGAMLLYGLCGTSRLEIAAAIMKSTWHSTGRMESPGGVSLAAMAGAVLLLAGISFRLSVFPGVDGTSNSAETAGLCRLLVQCFFPRAAAVAILLRLAETLLPVLHEPAVATLLVLCAMLALTGGLQIVLQRRPRHACCWLLMVQSAAWIPGLMAAVLLASPAAAGTVSEAADSGQALRHFLAVGFLAETVAVAGLLLLLLHWQQGRTPVRWQDDLAGLIRARPVTAGLTCTLLLAAAGFPPLMTFWSRLLVLHSAVSVHLESAEGFAQLLHPGLLAASTVAAGGLFCGVVAMLRLLATILLEPTRRVMAGSTDVLPLLAAAVLALCLVAGGLCPVLWWPGQ